jgi:hypothetical protein
MKGVHRVHGRDFLGKCCCVCGCLRVLNRVEDFQANHVLGETLFDGVVFQ